MQLTLISFISIGGTIASTVSPEGVKPSIKVDDLLHFIPGLSRITDEIRCHEPLSMDSANLQPHHWIKIAKAIYEEIKDPKVDGVVIAHGTDTMMYSLAASSFMLQNLGKPIVFTGSQIPMTEVGTDGERNLLDAFRVAATTNLAEVVLVFNSTIFRGTRARKMHAYALNAFTSIDQPPLGMITREIDILRNPLNKRNPQIKPTLNTSLNPSVALIKIFPGLNPTVFDALVTNGIKGIVLEAYGEGNLPIEDNSLIARLEELGSHEIPVVVTTQCIFGKSEMLYYETGRKAYEIGCIPGFDMISEVALVKLMTALVRTTKFADIKPYIHTPLAGEIHPPPN
ncbi:MAG: asparaginase [Candidatus Heimdallarchaeota archaeon]|nr:MAG: asparaginase [Candidatus Heimdallarchaeota archaeon]